MFVVFDIETTGLSTTSNDIIQFAYCLFDSNKQFVRAENLYYYYEGMSWSQEAADASHHLSLEYLKQYEDKFYENVLKMYSVLNRCNVIGHNSDSFDCPFVKNWLARRGLEDFAFGIQQDTMKAFKPITKRARIKLTKLTELLGFKQESVNYFASMWFGDSNIRGPHDAAYDVAATALLTLRGLSKNLISFETIQIGQEIPDTPEEFEDLSFETTKPFDPNSFLVMYRRRGTTDIEYRWFNHDRSKYCEAAVMYNANGSIDTTDAPMLDLVLEEKEDGSFCAENKGVTYELTLGERDELRVITPYLRICSSETNVLPIIKHNFGNGGG